MKLIKLEKEANMKVYIGKRKRSDVLVQIIEDGKTRELDAAPSQAIVNHSPDGFNWGYRGSGCAQLALAILLDAIEDPNTARTYYQDFKDIFVSGWDDHWAMPEVAIRNWLANEMLREN
ncbi:hypothetical protein CMI37_13780 [Candidatus Pacearchaeota archaeon]|nr:hypothetical protein [Candidatus Pacearchaeota archaeon]|tara:strand:- start:3682 stop:4038 length:357 start_codon:yes stop_codon:yes gene_type:complete